LFELKRPGSSPGGFCELSSQTFQFINYLVGLAYPARRTLSLSRFFRASESLADRLGISRGAGSGSDKEF
jgi:hypothetical protein